MRVNRPGQSELTNCNLCSFHVAHESFSSFDYIPEGAHQSGTLYIPTELPRVSKVEAHLAGVIAAAKAEIFLTLVLCIAVSACSWPAKQIAVEDVQNLHYQHVDSMLSAGSRPLSHTCPCDPFVQVCFFNSLSLNTQEKKKKQ